MKLLELIKNRYSVRAYLPKPVEEEKVNYILECARFAPSATNSQPWRYYVVKDDESIKQKLQEAYNREWFKTAPMYLIICKDSSASWKRTATDNKDFGDIDIAITAEHICLAATEVGLGTCWVCNFRPDILAQSLDLPNQLEPIVIFPLGYIDGENSSPIEKKRNLISDITKWI